MEEWERLSEPVQLRLADAALREATKNLAGYAEVLAAEMEAGFLPDRGGHEALRLFANIIRSARTADPPGVGHA